AVELPTVGSGRDPRLQAARAGRAATGELAATGSETLPSVALLPYPHPSVTRIRFSWRHTAKKSAFRLKFLIDAELDTVHERGSCRNHSADSLKSAQSSDS